jgi:hypothetical protein
MSLLTAELPHVKNIFSGNLLKARRTYSRLPHEQMLDENRTPEFFREEADYCHRNNKPRNSGH